MINNFENLSTELSHELLRINRPDSLYESTAQVFLNPLVGGWLTALDELGFELHAMIPILHPSSISRDPLAGIHRWSVADHGHEITMLLGLHPKHAVASLLVVVGDSLDETGNSHCLRRKTGWAQLCIGSITIDIEWNYFACGESMCETSPGDFPKTNNRLGMTCSNHPR